MELTKDEIKSIQAFDKEFNPNNIKSSNDARGQKVSDLIVFSLGRRRMHDSGYPFIRIFGRQYEQGVKPHIKYFDLGWHDHFLCNIRVNIDSYGKNLFRIMPRMGSKSFIVSPHFIGISTFEIGCMYPDIEPENTLS